MSTFVFARRKQDADDWANQQKLAYKDRYTFGNQSKWRDGFAFREGDRVVIIGELERVWESAITRCIDKAAHRPELVRLPSVAQPERASDF